MKLLAILFIVIGVINELSGFFGYLTAETAVQQIGAICLCILATLQFILAKIIWPKEAV